MNRSTLDKLISTSGLIIAIVLLLAAGGLAYAHNFIHSEVHNQLAAQRIMFPAADSAGVKALPPADADAMKTFAGQQLLTGAQAKTFADHYIAVHLQKVGGGRTYSELSTASLADPSNAMLAKQAQTVFQGETLRGLLLNAYAFDTMATVANIAAVSALAAGLVLLNLAVLGYYHASRVKTAKPKKR